MDQIRNPIPVPLWHRITPFRWRLMLLSTGVQCRNGTHCSDAGTPFSRSLSEMKYHSKCSWLSLVINKPPRTKYLMEVLERVIMVLCLLFSSSCTANRLNEVCCWSSFEMYLCKMTRIFLIHYAFSCSIHWKLSHTNFESQQSIVSVINDDYSLYSHCYLQMIS